MVLAPRAGLEGVGRVKGGGVRRGGVDHPEDDGFDVMAPPRRLREVGAAGHDQALATGFGMQELGVEVALVLGGQSHAAAGQRSTIQRGRAAVCRNQAGGRRCQVQDAAHCVLVFVEKWRRQHQLAPGHELDLVADLAPEVAVERVKKADRWGLRAGLRGPLGLAAPGKQP